MPIVGFNFTRINIEKKDKMNSGERINSNINITSVEQEKLNLKPSEEILRFNFEFTVDYSSAGEAKLNGYVVYLDSPDKIKDYLASWEENKTINPETLSSILNTILFKCNIKTLNLSQEVNLPPHIQLPRVTAENKK
ncbi:MAG TPA: hypothetical protein VJB89_02525 [Candidatus Nanoarchaeia archaeon]|nr:hypothetical protein [Candidatus Nanoarchaeia archaeon]